MGERSRDAEPAGRGHEERDVRCGRSSSLGYALAALAGLSLLAMWWLFDYFAARRVRLETDPLSRCLRRVSCRRSHACRSRPN